MMRIIMNWGLKNPWKPISNTMEDTTTINKSKDSGRHLGAETTGIIALAMSWAVTARGKEIQDPLPTGRHTVVLPKKIRPRKVVTQKIMVIWRNFTFMLLLRPAHPRHSAGRHKQKFALPYQGDIDFPELPEGHAEP